MSKPDSLRLTVEIKNKRPVQLLELTASFSAYAEEYQRFAQSAGHDTAGENVQLYVQEIRTGSIIADFISLAEQASIILEHREVLAGFASHLSEIAHHYLGNKKIENFSASKPQLKNYLNIFKPIAKDTGSQINNIVQDGGVVIQQFNITSSEAEKLVRAVSYDLVKKPIEDEQRFTDEALTVYQARDNSDSGNMGRIDRFSRKALKLLFANDEVRNEVMETEENVFHLIFIVDGKVIMSENTPVAYHISNVVDAFVKPE
ncbi:MULTISPECIES: hypothetical protein [Thalassospira]|uniref:Uncharacterized protein n=2 Tax=Thalassospira tepidiphila TaxID=393657 RepID=A0A853L068_9PROT|nr:hypothetical protein [Thalassospira tepidiphila]NJB76531.1 hypothetical protein [Thalassospira tepidiphila]OAZ09859.1 hypothetical protein TH4_11810 [Thalassospira tepidiphila MCCC 1A03514]